MKILLINPSARRENPYTAVGFRLPPLGLLYLASALRRAGHDVTVHDEVVHPGRRIDFGSYDLIGIGGDTPRHMRAVEIARMAKEEGKLVVMGGCHVTFQDREVICDGTAHVVVRGEGELTIVDLVDTLSRMGINCDLSNVPGISWIDREGNFHRNPDRQFISDLDELPFPARDLVDMANYRMTLIKDRPITGLFTSRGCPHNCNFCTTPALYGRKWRGHSPKRVVNEIEELVEAYGFRGIAFLDDNFIVDKERTMAICEEIIRRRLDILWWCACRADSIVKNQDLVRMMKEAGCWYCFLGLESSQSLILKDMGKKTSPDYGIKAVNILKRHGIRTMASFVIGHMNETRDDILDTLRYALMIDPASAQFCVLTPYPGTQIRKKYMDRIVSSRWDLYNSVCALMRTNFLEPEEIQSLLKKMYLRFYLRPARILRAIKGSFGSHTMDVKRTISLIRTIMKEGVDRKGN